MLLLLVSTFAPRAARADELRGPRGPRLPPIRGGRGLPRDEGGGQHLRRAEERRRYRGAAHFAARSFTKLHEGMAEVHKPGSMTLEQHIDVGTRVRAVSPGRLLVWGLGFDSAIFVQLNAGGRTHFVEPDSPWYQEKKDWIVPRGAEVSIYQARDLGTTVITWRDFAERPRFDLIFRDASVDFSDTCWDTIVIDSPNGHTKHAPGRAVPIYLSFVDVRRCIDGGDYRRRGVKDVVIYVHDFERRLETRLTRQFFDTFFANKFDSVTAGLEIIGEGRLLAKVTITLK